MCHLSSWKNRKQEKVLNKELVKGITQSGMGEGDESWNILGQRFYPKACCKSSFAFEAVSAPGDFFPVHIQHTRDAFLTVEEGILDVKLDGEWLKAGPGDLVRLPRGIAYGFFNRSENLVRALIWVSPAAELKSLFEKLDGLTDASEVVRISALHDLEFLPPEAND